MSRIITNNYFTKLNQILNAFEITPNLRNLIEFFLEDITKDQNRLRNRNQKIFTSNDLIKLNEIKSDEKLKTIYSYINILIKNFNRQYLHIHINEDLSENMTDNLVSIISWGALSESIYDDNILSNEIGFLKTEIKRDLIIPYDNNGHLTNQIFTKRLGLIHKLNFFEKIINLSQNTGNNGLLINLNTTANVCVNLSDFSIFPESINTFINFGNNLQSIYDRNNSVLQKISTIINVFPAERGKNIWYHDFIMENINAWNQLPEYNFSKIITVTSGKKNSEELLQMRKLNKFQSEEFYPIFSFEF
jgi:hypothetical protein